MPTSTRRRWAFYGGFPANPCRFPILHRRGGRPCPPARNARFYGKPMRNRNILMGGQSRPPLQTGYDRPVVSSNSVHQISAVPRYFGRKKSSDFANVGRIREIYIPRRRGRCPHRPARNGRFMAVFRRIRVDFLFYAVGADDPVRPPETPAFTENRCEFETFQWADRVVRPYEGYEKPHASGEKSPRLPFRTGAGRCGHRPLQITTKNQRISRADRVVRPYKGC